MNTYYVFWESGKEILPMNYEDFKNEGGLQKLLMDHPELVPTKEIFERDNFVFENRDRINPSPKFHILGANVEGIDILSVDENGVLTIIETKLAKNPESRREVIGQIFDYASQVWKKDCEAQKKVLEQIRSKFGDNLAKRVEENLEDRILRLIIAVDKIQPIVKRIIDFLMRWSDQFTIYGLEIQKYTNMKGESVLIVSLYPSPEEHEKVQREKTRILWTEESFLAALEQRQVPKLRLKRFKEIFRLAKEKGGSIEPAKKGSLTPFLNIFTKNKKCIVTCWESGKLYVVLRPEDYKDSETFNRFREGLEKLSIFRFLSQEKDIIHGRNSTDTIEKMAEEEFEEFIKLLEEVLVQ